MSAAPSDYSTQACCTFGNDYGDYTGIDASAGIAYPVWSDKRGGAVTDGEGYAFVGGSAATGAQPTPTPAPAPDTASQPPPAPVAPPPADTAAPRVSLRVRRIQDLARVLARGLGVRVGCSEGCRVSARLLLLRRVVASARTIGLRSISLTSAGSRRLTIRLNRRGKRLLRPARSARVRLRVSARDAAGNVRTVSRTVTLRR
jgi:hypothetical protein